MENNSLPERCCAKCGYLYGLALKAYNPEQYAVFDPDLIREKDFSNGGAFAPISSFPYIKVSKIAQHSLGHKISTTQEDYNWSNTKHIGCYKKKFLPIPGSWDKVEPEIQKDRKDCDGFYQHHLGYTPKQHTELQLNEQRFQQQEEHTRTLLDLQKQSNKTQRSLKWATWVLAGTTLILAVATVALVIATNSANSSIPQILEHLLNSQITPTP